MKTFLLSASLALGLGALALSPASAATVVKSSVATSRVADDAACRVVERRVRSGGVTRITRSRQCDDYDRPRYSERRVSRERAYGYGPRRGYRDGYRDGYRRDDRPGLSIRVN